MQIEAFLNECSLNGQFPSRVQYLSALDTLNLVLKVLLKYKAMKHDIKTFRFHRNIYDKNIYNCCTFRQEASEKKSDGYKNFRLYLDRLAATDWTINKSYSCIDNFYCNGIDVSETSMAEAAERQTANQNKHDILLNFVYSKFSNACIVVKNQSIKISIETFDSSPFLETSLNHHFTPYLPSAKEPPTDPETILIDSARFTLTAKRNQSRKVHFEIKTGRYWCVDNLHYGISAHLEVFDSTGNHLGEANIASGELNTDRADSTKHLPL